LLQNVLTNDQGTYVRLGVEKAKREKGTAMITIKSKVKDVCESPEALAVIKEVYPAFDATDPRMKQAYGMSLQALLAFPASGCPKEARLAVAEALEDACIE
jgi:hypothetical protein